MNIKSRALALNCANFMKTKQTVVALTRTAQFYQILFAVLLVAFCAISIRWEFETLQEV